MYHQCFRYTSISQGLFIVMLLLLLSACGQQPTAPPSSPSPTPIVAPDLSPIATLSPITNTVEPMITDLPPMPLTLRDIPLYPDAQQLPPDKDPAITSLLNALRAQVAAGVDHEGRAFRILGASGVDAATIAEDVEIFYDMELAEWERQTSDRFTIPSLAEPSEVAFQGSWRREDAIVTFVVMQHIGDYFLLQLLEHVGD